MRKRLLSILLLCCMVLTLLPTAAVAKANYTGSAATAAVTDNAHRWDTKIEITNVTIGQEYAITTGSTAPTGGWQNGGVFTGLKKDTTYTVYTRVKATDTMAASNAVTTSVKTKKAMSIGVFDWGKLNSWVGSQFYDGSAKVPPVKYASGYSADTVGGFTFKYEDKKSGASVTECKLPGTYDFYIVTDNTGSEYAAGESHMGVFTISRGNLTAADFQVTGLTHDYDGSPKKATVAPKPGVEGVGAITVYYEDVAPTVYTRQTTAPTNAGSYKVSVDVATGDYYNGINNLVLGTLTINKVNYTGTPFTGTVNIKGAPKYGETLTAEVTDTNNTGTLTYQWYRAGKTDPIGTGETYTPVLADIDKKITCVVSSKNPNLTGTIQATVGPIEKADGPAAPVLELDFRSINIIKVKTLGNAYEYRIDNGAWQDLRYFENLQPGREYTITARAKGTATQKPGAVSDPLIVTTLYDKIPDDLRDKLGAVVSAYIAEYDGMEHEAVIVDMSKMPEGWRIAGYTTGDGDNFEPQKPMIRDASDSSLTVKTKFTHEDYSQFLIAYSYARITPKPLTADMIADIPPQRYTGQSIHPTPEIKDGDMFLVKGRDFTYSYDTNTSPEQGGKVTINGMGNYKDTAFKTFTIVNEITKITEDDLKDLEIPTLVTVKCKTTDDSKAYGSIPGGFDLSNATPYMDNGVLKAIVQLNLSAYKAKYDADTKKTHEYAGGEGNPHAAFTLKYVIDKWELDGNFPNLTIWVKCDGQHPQTPPYPTEENVGGLEQVQVLVQCSTDTAQFKNYGILPGSVSIMPDANDPSQATLTLIPSVYSKQYTIDTGITHSVAPNQATDNLKIQMRYDPDVGKWMPGELTTLKVLVQCNNHQGQRCTINFNGNGGTPSVTSMTTIDQKLPELPTATHSGRYSFDGWYTAASGGTKITTAYVFSADTTAYAHWTYTGGYYTYYTYYTIKATAGTNGSISPSGWTSVRHGWDQTFTITPDKGYAVAKVLVDGKSVGSVKSYTFKNVTKDHTIEVVFVKGTASPSTGDSSNLPLWSALLLASTLTLAGTVHYKRKRAR